jgi:hypothetical protein
MTFITRTVFLFMGFIPCAGITAERPTKYVDEGACPFECCTYREWTVKTPTTLLTTPDEQSKPIGVVRTGEKVDGLTGFVVTIEPGLIEVLRPHASKVSNKTYNPKDLVWVYTNLGEGFFRVWFQGQMYEEEASFFVHGLGGWDRCVEEKTCWGQRKHPPKAMWWVKVKSKSGIVGWSNKPERFGNKDACG